MAGIIHYLPRMDMPRQTSFTIPLDREQQQALEAELRRGNYRGVDVPYARVAAERPDCRIVLYQSGKCVAQGTGAQDWVQFVLEPKILRAVVTGYDDVRDPDASKPHMGVDESGKGDFFGPMVIAAAYADAPLVAELRRMRVRDSKTITSDRKAEEMSRDLRKLLANRFVTVTIGPEAYNRLYASMGSVNRMLAWGHARAIESLLELVPDCPRAVADQFGPERQIRDALMRKGRSIRLEQRHRAESDPAVAAASILARAGFLAALRHLGEQHKITLPKGASDAVRAAAEDLVRRSGPAVLTSVAKCHFRTADLVLKETGHARADLGPLGRAVSKSADPARFRRRTSAPHPPKPAGQEELPL